MQTRFGHLQINVRAENLPFYRDLMGFLGWNTLLDEEAMLGVGDANHSSLWFVPTNHPATNDYDGLGVNHIGIGVESQGDVDTAATWLTDRGIPHLFDTPRHRPEFTWQEGQTYYQVMFETPDHLLIEIVYIGPKQ